MKCTACKNEALRSWEGPLEMYGVEIMARGLRCSACGEVECSYDDMGHNERAAAVALVARGIRSGTEFKFVRKVVGLKVTEVADLLGVTPETVSRWEDDTIDEESFQRAFAVVLHRYDKAFQALAAFDRGDH